MMPVMTERLTDHQLEVLDLHFNARHGSPYWIERAARQGVRVGDVMTLSELIAMLGPMEPGALRRRPAMDFVPRAVRRERAWLITCETGGATGPPSTTAYRRDEFRAAFVEPFVRAAAHVGFPRGGQWLWVGPSGPHIIGRAAEALARAMGAAAPFCVDFDPRWYRRLAPGSLARERYLDHVAEQAGRVLDREPIDVLFTTPSVLERLAGAMSEAQRAAVRGVHYGGQRLGREALRRFQEDLFPNAVHLAGYGNTLFGCCLELDAAAGREPVYFPWGERLVLHGPEPGCAEPAQVRFSRFDRSGLILDMPERDAARLAPAPPDAPAGFAPFGLVDPHPAAAERPVDAGLY